MNVICRVLTSSHLVLRVEFQVIVVANSSMVWLIPCLTFTVVSFTKCRACFLVKKWSGEKFLEMSSKRFITEDSDVT